MDPLTLFALANGAVAAVKQGCKLYKDIQGAMGDVKSIINDLDKSFNAAYAGKKPPAEAKRQLQEEKNRVIELSKREPGDVYDEIGQHLSLYFENMAKCIALWEEQERQAKQVYTGEDSIGKRAVQRVLLTAKLEKMNKDLRELMVYECPPELGDLYTRVSAMMEKIGEEQRVAIRLHLKQQAIIDRIKKQRRDKLIHTISLWVAALIIVSAVGVSMVLIAEDRARKYPHLGNGLLPRSEYQQYLDSLPQVYVGR